MTTDPKTAPNTAAPDAGENKTQTVMEPHHEGEEIQPAPEWEQQIAELTQERDQLREQLLRTFADLQNFRKRSQQQIEDTRRYANEDIMQALIPVLDNFERTMRSLEAGADPEAILQGVNMVERQLRTALEANSLKRMAAVGEVFDPEFHEALGTVETEEFEPNVVVEELEAGYLLFGRVVRPAKVRVAQRPQ